MVANNSRIDHREYGEWIFSILKHKNWTGTELAKNAGLAPSTILRPLNDEAYDSIPSFKTITAIVRASGCKPSEGMLNAFNLRSEWFDSKEASGSRRLLNAEEIAPFDSAGPADLLMSLDRPARMIRRVEVAAGDELVLPTTLMDAIGVSPNETVVVEVHGDELRIRPTLAALRRLQARLKAALPEGCSLADELIAERRAEAIGD